MGGGKEAVASGRNGTGKGGVRDATWSAGTKHTQPRAMAEKHSLALAGSGVQCSNDDRVCTCSNVRRSKWRWGIHIPSFPGFPQTPLPLLPRAPHILGKRGMHHSSPPLVLTSLCTRRCRKELPLLLLHPKQCRYFPPQRNMRGGKTVCERKIGGPGLDFLSSVPSQAQHFHSFSRDNEWCTKTTALPAHAVRASPWHPFPFLSMIAACTRAK